MDIDIRAHETKKRARRLASTSVLPFALLLLAILAAVVLTVFAMAQRASDAADDRNRRVIMKALTEVVSDMAKDARSLAAIERPVLGRAGRGNHAAIEGYLERIRQLGDFESVTLMDAGGTTLRSVVDLTFGQEAPESAVRGSLAWVSEQIVRSGVGEASGGRPSVHGRYLVEDGALRLVAAVALPSQLDAPDTVIVATRRIDDEGLRRWATSCRSPDWRSDRAGPRMSAMRSPSPAPMARYRPSSAGCPSGRATPSCSG